VPKPNETVNEDEGIILPLDLNAADVTPVKAPAANDGAISNPTNTSLFADADSDEDINIVLAIAPVAVCVPLMSKVEEGITPAVPIPIPPPYGFIPALVLVVIEGTVVKKKNQNTDDPTSMF
jgi:hypothetical protein